MDDWLTWENGLFAIALLIAVSSLVGLMRRLRDEMVADITEKIETVRKRRLIEEARQAQETARLEQIRRREEHLERIRNERPAA